MSVGQYAQSTLFNANIINKDNFVYLNVTPGNTGGVINILNDFDWISEGGYVDEVPYIMAKELELNFGQIVQNLTGVATGLASTISGSDISRDNADPNDPYALLYSAHTTGFNYIFPHLVKDGGHITGKINNTWTKSDVTIGSKQILTDFAKKYGLGGISDFLTDFSHTVNLGTEDIYYYNNTTPRTLKISFPLYNTIDEAGAIRNADFVNLFSLQNTKMRTSFLTYIPPKVYVLESPGTGGVYMPLAYVKSFDVHSIGTTRFLNTGNYAQGAYASASSGYNGYGSNGRLIPEAYKIEITFEEVYPVSSNIVLGAIGGNKVNVVNDTTNAQGNTVIGANIKGGLVTVTTK